MGGQRRDGLGNAGRHQMHERPRLTQPDHRFHRARHQRGDVPLSQILDLPEGRLNDVQSPPVNLVERNLAVHGGVGEARDLRITSGQLVDALDGDERRVDVEENEAEARSGQ